MFGVNKIGEQINGNRVHKGAMTKDSSAAAGGGDGLVVSGDDDRSEHVRRDANVTPSTFDLFVHRYWITFVVNHPDADLVSAFRGEVGRW